MKKKLCPWSKKCRNGNDGCYFQDPENCIRFLPIEGTNISEISVIVETPPEIDNDKFSQYFINWIDSMGWSFCGSISSYLGEKQNFLEE